MRHFRPAQHHARRWPCAPRGQVWRDCQPRASSMCRLRAWPGRSCLRVLLARFPRAPARRPSPRNPSRSRLRRSRSPRLPRLQPAPARPLSPCCATALAWRASHPASGGGGRCAHNLPAALSRQKPALQGLCPMQRDIRRHNVMPTTTGAPPPAACLATQMCVRWMHAR